MKTFTLKELQSIPGKTTLNGSLGVTQRPCLSRQPDTLTESTSSVWTSTRVRFMAHMF